MLTYVTNKVAVATENQQIPWQSVSKEIARRDAEIDGNIS